MIRHVLAALVATGGLAIAAADAAATPLSGSSIPQPVSPPPDAQIPYGTIPTFVIQRSPGGSNYGGRYDGTFDSYGIRVSADPTTLSDGTIQAEADSSVYMQNVTPQLTWQWTPSNRAYAANWWLKTPGIYYWQPYRQDCYQDTDCRVEGPMRRIQVMPAAPVPAMPPPPPPPPPAAPTVPAEGPADWAAGLLSDPIPLSIGRARNHHSFYINDQSAPDGVEPERFNALVVNAGLRWGDQALGTTSRAPNRDGQNTVAFGTPDEGALATTVFYGLVRYKRVCGRYHCVRRVADRKLTGETDMILGEDYDWEQGPDYPDGDHFDLQTVLIHEMGHFAGNDHVPGSRCQNNPMIKALNTGEYWRSPTDWHFRRCGLAALLAGKPSAASSPRPLTARVIWTTV